MKETKTIRVDRLTEVGSTPYYAGVYVLPTDEAAKLIEAGGIELKAPGKATAEAREAKTASK